MLVKAGCGSIAPIHPSRYVRSAGSLHFEFVAARRGNGARLCNRKAYSGVISPQSAVVTGAVRVVSRSQPGSLQSLSAGDCGGSSPQGDRLAGVVLIPLGAEGDPNPGHAVFPFEERGLPWRSAPGFGGDGALPPVPGEQHGTVCHPESAVAVAGETTAILPL